MSDHSRIFAESILKDLEDSENGFFQIESKNGLAYLKVTRPGRNGSPVELNDVINRLKLFGISNFDKGVITKIIENADGNEYEIAKWSDKSEDMNLEIEISEDKMSAYITLSPPKHGGRLLSTEEIVLRLRGRNIMKGVLTEEIEKSLQEEFYFQKFLAAKGKPPKKGTDGYINILFNSGKSPDLKEDKYGKVDFKNINIIRSVEENTVIAEKVDPEAGEFGENIFGEVIPYETAREEEWKVGLNTEVSPDGKRLIAKITGRPVLERGGGIRVDEICHLSNVDYSTGNVDFPGTIIVDGSIVDDFRLKTKGSIVLKNSVGRVFLYAQGDIILSGGFMGKNGGVIESGSDIYAKFVEQGKLSATGSIFIQEASMHSELLAGESIVIKGGKGELIGGEAVAGKNISVLKLGAIVETPTKVSVGIPPTILAQLDKIKREISEKEEVMKKVDISKKKLVDIAAKKELSNEDQAMLTKLIEVESKFQNQLNSLNSQYESAVSSYEPCEESYVEVEQSIFPKVEINMGKGKFFRSEIKTFSGKNCVCIGLDGNINLSSTPPKKIKKTKT
ncbi:MAG: FapA family protein [Leptospiraceae bacterium]|nr:DUF342 domain-containing protein [Leptospiraceae bacterium]MCK6381106.1 FapA family protein [Leptospiraceae bacterium]NUM41947.1 DUF342 domain-containing protein [Leptospiraceae bacterium]